MFDILLNGIIQTLIRNRWWAAVISGAISALLFVGLLSHAGLLPT